MKRFGFVLLALIFSFGVHADEGASSGLKIKRSSGKERPAGDYSASLDHLAGASSQLGYQTRPVGEQEASSFEAPTQHPLGESLVIPKRKPFSDW